MRFGTITLDEAEGAILAHSIRLDSGALKKGRVLSAKNVAALRAAGRAHVIAAKLEPGDVPEDEAAARVARAALGANASAAEPFTGRANLFSDVHGLALVDAERVGTLNAGSETVTIATVAPFEEVAPRQMLATVKIIPFSAREDAVSSAVETAGAPGPLVAVAPFTPHRAGLVITRLPQTKDQIVEKSRKAIEDRLMHLGSTLGDVIECGHDEGAVAEAVARLRQAGCDPILVFGASAIVDRGDVIPAGVVKAGGEVLHLGMPVDPGNLLMLGRLEETSVVGVPSCARSPKVNGFDWVLQRLLAGLDVTGVDVAAMGAGGLLKEIPSRPRPRESEVAGTASRAPTIAAVVLAAGQSRRMGPVNKLLETVGDMPMVRRVVENVLASDVSEVVVVLGHEAARVRVALDGLEVNFVVNEDHAEGLSTSLKAGLEAVSASCDGAVVCLGDMPLVSPRHIDRLIAAFDPGEGRGICVPVVDGKRGNPVLWARAYFTEMAGVQGDVGARHLLGQFADDVCEVDMGDRAVMTDIDTPEALRAVTRSDAVEAETEGGDGGV